MSGSLSLFESNAPVLEPGELFRLRQGDAVEFLASLPSGSVNLGCTDPAYESLEKHRSKGTTTRLKQSDASSNEWFEIFKNERFPALFREFYRVLADDSHLYVLCDQETMFAIKPMGEAAGFKFWKPIVWHKGTIGMGYHFRALYEVVLFFEKGKRRLNDLGIGDVLSVPDAEQDEIAKAQPYVIKEPRVRDRDAYPTEKPVRLLEVLVQQSSEPGEIVVDPFTGSGSCGEAALRNGRRFLGNDLKASAVIGANARLRKHREWGQAE